MKKSIAVGILFCMLFIQYTPLSLAVDDTSSPSEKRSPLVYPEWERFDRLEEIISSTFTLGRQKSYGKCIDSGWLCPNYRYTSVTEKALKYILVDTYTGNEWFYTKLFSSYTYSYGGDISVTSSGNLLDRLNSIPVGTPVLGWISSLFSSSTPNIASELMWASFGLDFTENTQTSGMLGAIETKIQEMKRQNCNSKNTVNTYLACPYEKISNIYLPTPEELTLETIYLNGLSVKIATLTGEIDYQISWNLTQATKITNQFPNPVDINIFLDTILPYPTLNNYRASFLNIEKIRDTPNLYDIDSTISFLDRILATAKQDNLINKNEQVSRTINDMVRLLDEMTFYKKEFQKNVENISYTLSYKKNNFTLVEAQAELDKKIEATMSRVLEEWNGRLPCMESTSYMARSQCTAATSFMRDTISAMWAYYADRETYPDNIDQLNTNYLPRGLDNFKKYFTYQKTTRNGNPSFDITYIGTIGEWESEVITDKKDYVALMSGMTLPEIPLIFSHVPRDSMVLYAKNPQDLLALLSVESNTSTRISGIDVSLTVKKALQDFFELQEFTTLEKNLRNEMVLVVDNLDMTAPDITMIISEADKTALSPTAQARVVGSKDGYIYISSSKVNIDRLMNLKKEDSLSDAPDFHYVWIKKSSLIRDAFFFVGDAFFEKMLSLETYITHYRKYHDTKILSQLQELSWSYEDAFSKKGENIDLLLRAFKDTLPQSLDLTRYSIADGIISDSRIGSIKSRKTLSEVSYDLAKITRWELEDYKVNILKYRDTWRASLDPMGIVLNRYGDGMEIDFFMTPIPHLADSELASMQDLFEWVTKDSLSFVSNPRIRMGLLSLVFGIDPEKIKWKISGNAEIAEWFQEFNKEILDGKNILDYLGWEWALTLGNIPSDILDGWNIEKIDAYFSLQVVNEEKWKELIEIIRKKMMDEMGWGSASGVGGIGNFLAKPLIEDYSDKKIYYVEAIPIPFVWKIGFAYTFVDDFFFLAPNRSTIRRIIDTAKSWDIQKKRIIDTHTAWKWSFFLALFDGESASVDIRGLYEKNKSSLPRYASYLDADIIGSQSITSLLSLSHASSTRDKRLGKNIKPFSYTIGWLRISENEKWISVRIDEKDHLTLSWSTLQMWQNLISEEALPKDILTEKGIPLEDFMDLASLQDILSLELIVQLDRAFAGKEALLRNFTFSLNMGDDEIGFSSRIFREKSHSWESGWLSISPSKDIFIIVWVVVLLMILGWGAYIIRERRKNIALSVTPAVPVDISPDTPKNL